MWNQLGALSNTNSVQFHPVLWGGAAALFFAWLDAVSLHPITSCQRKIEFQRNAKLALDITSLSDILVKMNLYILYHNGGKI